MLTARQEAILKLIVAEYVASGVPVASEGIARDSRLTVSPATIRHEMAELEELGYILRPHISAGGVPSDKGYRYYVEALGQATALPLSEQRLLEHLFHQVERELEEWVTLSATFLSRFTGYMAMVTRPQAVECRLKRLELVSLQEFLALMVLIIWEARVKQQLLAFDRPVSQEELDQLAQRFNRDYAGLSIGQIQEKGLPSGYLEEATSRAMVRALHVEAEKGEEPYIYGLRQVLEQPEFSQGPGRQGVLAALEEKSLLRAVLAQLPWEEGVQVIIGKENKEDTLQDLSLVASRYGIPGKVSGAVAILGPTRMKYLQAISAVHYLSHILSRLVKELYG